MGVLDASRFRLCHVLEAVLWILNTGAQWHMLPQSYPNYKTVHRRFQTWCCHEILRLVLTDVANELRENGALDEEATSPLFLCCLPCRVTGIAGRLLFSLQQRISFCLFGRFARCLIGGRPRSVGCCLRSNLGLLCKFALLALPRFFTLHRAFGSRGGDGLALLSFLDGGRPFDERRFDSPTASDTSVHRALEVLATAQSEAAATLHINGFVEALSDSLVQLGSASHVTKSADAMDALAKMQQLAARTGDRSNLTLDTDLDTYYIQNIVVNQIPKSLSLLGGLAILAAQTSSRTTYSRDNEVRFLVLDGLIKSAIDAIKDNLMAAYRGSPDDALKHVDSTYGTLFSAVDTYVVGRRGSIFAGGKRYQIRQIGLGQYRKPSSIDCCNCELIGCAQGCI